jgi:hypothetical protein
MDAAVAAAAASTTLPFDAVERFRGAPVAAAAAAAANASASKPDAAAAAAAAGSERDTRCEGPVGGPLSGSPLTCVLRAAAIEASLHMCIREPIASSAGSAATCDRRDGGASVGFHNGGAV